MRIRTLTINRPTEVVVKIIKEVLTLYKVELVGGRGEADYAQLSVVNQLQDDRTTVGVSTRIYLYDAAGNEEVFSYCGDGQADERESAAINRLIKLNVYRFFRERFQMPQAPWGILHGVRPTKIVHRWLRSGMERENIICRLHTDYDCSHSKAALITDIAYRQLPYLATARPRLISLYVGIPFCLTRCLYCSFPANLLPNPAKLAEFMAVLRRDLEAVREDVTKLGLSIQSIYVGGGTPTSLPYDYFAEMLEIVYNFFYDQNIVEFTVESGRPDSLTAAKIMVMKRLNVSRVSVNPQSMEDATLKRIGRNHTAEDIRRMVSDLRASGDFQINMDLILGLPGETAETVAYSLEEVAKLKPDDVTLHALAIKKGSNLKLMLDNGDGSAVNLSGDEETAAMSVVAARMVGEMGLKPYYLYRQGYMSGDLENVGYSRVGAESMYNIQIMEENQTIIGIGSGATTKVVNARFGRMYTSFNAKDLPIYMRDIELYIAKRRKLLYDAYQPDN